MDEARLWANAREVRTLLTELGAVTQAYVDRIANERRTDCMPTDAERTNIESAQSHLLGNLATPIHRSQRGIGERHRLRRNDLDTTS